MSDPKPIITLSLFANVTDEPQAVKVWEVLGRAAMGLALEGVQVSTHIDVCQHDHDGEEVEP